MIDTSTITNTIINADCLDILKQLPDKCIDLVLTDPPYNASNSNISFEDKNYHSVNEKWDKDFNATDFLEAACQKLKPSGSMLVFCSYHTLSQYLCFDKMKIQQIIHWQKTNPFPAITKVYTPSIEYCVWLVNGSPYCFNKQYVETNVISFSTCQGKERIAHPTQKPLKLIQQLLVVHSNENDLVLDCFSGSGTTAVACHNLKRRFICIEKDPEYWAASVKRLEEVQRQLTFDF